MNVRLALTVALLPCACTGGSSSSDGATACNPFAVETAPIALVDVLAAGKHADGTIYVIDRGRPEYRVFVSNGTDLGDEADAHGRLSRSAAHDEDVRDRRAG